MKYNTERPPLRIGEYGRNVQDMVEYIKTLPTKEERTVAANNVVNIMGLLNPAVKEQSDYKHKLWDHLYIISEYDLDIDSPYPMPKPEERNRRPDKPSYASNHIRYRYYGKNVERMIQKAINMEEGKAKEDFINALASYMKMAFRMWNDDKAPDELVIKHIREMSGGKIEVTEVDMFTSHTEGFQKPKRRDYQGGGKQQHHRNKQNKKNFRKR